MAIDINELAKKWIQENKNKMIQLGIDSKDIEHHYSYNILLNYFLGDSIYNDIINMAFSPQTIDVIQKWENLKNSASDEYDKYNDSIYWRIHIVDTGNPFDILKEYSPLDGPQCALEWGWTAGIKKSKLQNYDGPIGKQGVILNLEMAKDLRDQLIEWINKNESR